MSEALSMQTTPSLPVISPAEAKRLLAQGAVLIDIREPAEHARERIAQARNVPVNVLGSSHDLSGPLIFHCRTGKRTSDNAHRLRAAAGGEAYLLAGGIDAWRDAGLPVIVDTSQPIEICRQVMIAAGSLVLLGVLLGSLVRPEFYALPGLIGGGLVFAGVSGWCGLAKLLGLMPWNRVRGA